MKGQVLLTDFGEGNQLAAGLSGFVDEVDSLLHAGLEVEPLWRVSNSDTGRSWVCKKEQLTPGSEVTAAALYLVIGILGERWLCNLK